MAINFPTSLDNLTNPNTTDALNSPSHAGQHADANDAIEALQAKVGANSSAVTSSHDYKIAQLESGKVDKSTYDAHTILQATTDNTPVALTVGEQTVVGRATGGNISALSIDSDLSSVSANDDTIPSAKATKAYTDLMIPKSLVDAKGDIITATADNTPARLAVGTNGYVLTADSGETTGLKWAAAAGGTSLWTAITATRASNTTCTVVGDQTAIFKKGMIIRWQESGADKVGMVSIPSTVSTDTTITFIGDTMASIDSGTFKYSVILGAEPYIARFAYAGTVGAVASNVMNAYYATEPMKVIGADLQAGTAGTTNNSTVDINKNGTTMFTTKPTLATTVASSPTPFTADTTSALALGDKVTIDVDAVQTTAAIDLYVQLYLFPTRFLTLS